jgi:predicted GTPase
LEEAIMKWWRWYILLVLFILPFLILSGLGFLWLWQSGWGLLLGWILLGCIGASYYLAIHWQKQQKLLKPLDAPSPVWTERDQAAWKIVEAQVAVASQLDGTALLAPTTYQQTAEQLALDLARHYHPTVKDPISALTIPELLTVMELATHDLALMVDQYLPGGHLLTIRDLRRLQQAAQWYPTIRNITWIISALFSPLNTAARYAATKVSLNKPWQMLQNNVVLWFYTAFVHRLGHYLIELQSGRLKVGAERYRKLQEAYRCTTSISETQSIHLVLLGQTSAGKSSLVNALLGEQRAFIDQLPATAHAQEYVLRPEGLGVTLRITDTVGYGTQGPTESEWKHTLKLAEQADLVFLVLHARQPGRQVDVEQLTQFDRYFTDHPELLRPAVASVVTHIDLLSPMMEWSPPYDWQQPTRPKEQNIHDAVEATRTQLSSLTACVIPVCTAPGKIYGIEEGVLPMLATLLNQAKGVALLRVLHREGSEHQVRRVFEQLLAVGKTLVKTVWDQRRKSSAT